MRVYFRLFNFCALNFGAFYSTKYRRWYVQLIPAVLCMVVVVGRPQRDGEVLADSLLDTFGFNDAEVGLHE